MSAGTTIVDATSADLAVEPALEQTTPATLCVELFTEELPPKALKRLGEAFSMAMIDGLRSRNFLNEQSVATPYATPRRLAMMITHVRSVAPDMEIVDKLMPVKVARDATGQPTDAFKRKLAGLGRAELATASLDAQNGPDRIYVASDGKADYVYLRSLAAGQPLQRGLEETLDDALDKLPIPKVMSYASGTDGGVYFNNVKFVRPAHRLLALHGADVVPIRALELAAGRVTGGHRFLARSDIDIAHADAYEETLRAEGKVIAGFAERRGVIVTALRDAAIDATIIMPEALLDEVTALVEWPVVYEGRFDPEFLRVPQECLILTMQQNQKYFALAASDGKLVPRFLVVSNLQTLDPTAIIEGNERVLRARLADARFFYDQDRKMTLASRLPKLAAIVYHNKLGTLSERVERIAGLAREIATTIGADPDQAARAAQLAKADLTTDMVGEFPELQGLMGRYYAQHDGEEPDVAAAIEQHYWPRFAGDTLPEHKVAQAVALADKLETLAGMFGIGAQPTGDKDPFGLRRHAIGVIRIVIEKALPLTLSDLLRSAYSAFDGNSAVKADAQTPLADFLYERLRVYLRDEGFTANQAEAVLCQRPERIDLVPAQAAAVRAFGELTEAQALASANKRIVNILRKSGSDAAATVDRARLDEGAEHDLYLAFQKLEPVVRERCAAGDFAGALLILATVKPVVDRFFDDVLVMADDPAIRANRLALLRGVAQTMNRVADISKLAA